MSRLRRILLRLWNACRPARAELDLAREMAAHLALLEDDFQRRGMTPGEARLLAKRAFGGMEQAKELHREARSFRWLDDTQRDIGYAAGLLGRNPLFALTAALSLAIGIGATTTIFTVANGLLFRAATGVAQPQRLVDISRTEQHFGVHLISYPTYLDIRQRATTLDGVFAYGLELQPMSLGTLGISTNYVTRPNTVGAQAIFGSVVTTNYFTVLGVSPAAGRLFGAGDREQLGASPIVVLSHSFWARRFNRDPAIVGQTLQLNGHPFTVVGVAHEGFQGTTILAGDVWVPIGATPFTDSGYMARQAGWGLVGGRLKLGVSAAQAAAEVDAIGRGLERDYPTENRGAGLSLAASSPIPAGLRVAAAGFLALLMGIVSLVLIIACANVTGILLARATARRREIAVRLALGAGRARLVRQLLTETLLLFALGGAAGLLLARGMTTLLIGLLPASAVPIDVSLPLDGRVVAFAAGLSLVAAVLSGLAPALHASKADLVSALKDEAQGPSDRLRLRSAFVVAQVAFSILLVVVAGLLVRALEQVGSVDRGFDPRGVEAASLDLSLAGYTATTGPLFARDLVDRVRDLPGVQAATLAAATPSGGMLGFGVTVPGVEPPNGEPYFQAIGNNVEPNYFATLRLPLVAGRDFSAADRDGAQPVAIVGEGAARRFWSVEKSEDAVGKYLALKPMLLSVSNAERKAPKPLLVIGVARDLKLGGPADAPRPFVYVPLAQQYTPRISIVVRTTRGQRLASEIHALVATMDPRLPILTERTLEDQEGPVVVQLRVAAAVSGSVGIVGLLLAALGIYGVTAYAVARRTREFGIRIAMGAQSADVIGMVLWQGMSLVALGAAIGLLLSAAATQVLTRLLFGIPRIDPVTFGGSVALFAAIGLVACYVPARRATAIDATEALRYE